MKTDLEKHAIVYLIKHYRFYAEMFFRMKKTYTKDSSICPTIGVRFISSGLELIINENFIKQFSVKQLAAIFAHECEHPARDHYERAIKLIPEMVKTKNENEFNKMSVAEKIKVKLQHSLVNQAQDYAINQDISGLPRSWKLVDNEGNFLLDKEGKEIIGKGCFLEFLQEDNPNLEIKENQASEYYYGILKQLEKENPSSLEYLTIDDHSLLDNSVAELGQEYVTHVLKKVLNDAAATTPGKLPNNIKLLIEELNTSKVDWKKEIRNFRNIIVSNIKEETRKRRNRRYGILYPGKRVNDIAHIAVAVDTSGSTGKYWEMFFNEINSLYNTGIKITVIQCDCVIQSVKVFDKNTEKEICGGGGTSFKPVFDLVISNEFKKDFGPITGLIYLTDGEDYDTIEKPTFPVLWALTPGGKVKYDWGRQTQLKDENAKV